MVCPSSSSLFSESRNLLLPLFFFAFASCFLALDWTSDTDAGRLAVDGNDVDEEEVDARDEDLSLDEDALAAEEARVPVATMLAMNCFS